MLHVALLLVHVVLYWMGTWGCPRYQDDCWKDDYGEGCLTLEELNERREDVYCCWGNAEMKLEEGGERRQEGDLGGTERVEVVREYGAEAKWFVYVEDSELASWSTILARGPLWRASLGNRVPRLMILHLW
jgi:hypothetical protein